MELAHGLAHEIRQNRPVSVTVDVEFEAKIAEAVAARRPMIADLVRQAVDRELVALVDVELDAALRLAVCRDH